MKRIALDLELEQPHTNPQTPDSAIDKEKIIQVGYVVFDDKSEEYLEEVCEHVYYPLGLSSFIKQLTKISDADVMQGVPLESIIAKLHDDRKKHGASRKLLTWGGGDQPSIRAELGTEHSWGFGYSAFNVKHLFQFYQELTEKNPSGGLKKSMNKLGLRFSGTAHNALADAKNTARIFIELKKRLKPQA